MTNKTNQISMGLHIGTAAKIDVSALFPRHVAADRSSSKDSSAPCKPADSTADPSSVKMFDLLTRLMLAEVLTACNSITSSFIPRTSQRFLRSFGATNCHKNRT